MDSGELRAKTQVGWKKTRNNAFFLNRLLDVLAARKDPHGLSGDVLINGAPRPANFKCNSGYVVQVSICGLALWVSLFLYWASALAPKGVCF